MKLSNSSRTTEATTTQVSDLVSFSVADIPNSADKTITIYYDDPLKIYNNLMLHTPDLSPLFRDDFVLISMDKKANLNSEVTLGTLKNLYASSDNKNGIIIKKGKQGEDGHEFFLYGHAGKLIPIDPIFGDLTFPKDNNIATLVKPGAITAEMYSRITWDHRLVVEQSMVYSEDTKKWSVTLDRSMPATARANFSFLPNVTPQSLSAEKQQAFSNCNLKFMSSNPKNEEVLSNDLYLYRDMANDSVWYATKTANDIVRGKIIEEQLREKGLSDSHFQNLLKALMKDTPNIQEVNPVGRQAISEIAFKRGHTPAHHENAMISLENGKPHPWIYPDATLHEKGKLEKYCYKSDGSITGPVVGTEYKLKDDERFITLYLPPGYDPTRNPPYRLQITLDGSENNIKDLQLNTTLDNLIAANQIDPVIVAFVPSYDGNPEINDLNNIRYKEYGCNPNTANKLASLPAILHDSLNLNINPNKTQTIMGFSMGATQAIYTALLYPNVFGDVMAQCPAVWWSSLNRILLLPDGANIPSSIPNDAIMMVKNKESNEISIHKMLDGKIICDSVLNEVSQFGISSHFPIIGEKPNEITMLESPDLFDKITLMCSKSFPRGGLPWLNDGQEQVRKIVETGFDERTGQAIQSLPINFYIQKGDLEFGYRLDRDVRPATERLAKALQTKEHYKVIAHETWRGGHDLAACRTDISKLQINISMTAQLSNVSEAANSQPQKKPISRGTITCDHADEYSTIRRLEATKKTSSTNADGLAITTPQQDQPNNKSFKH
jgi:hypothetical protein